MSEVHSAQNLMNFASMLKVVLLVVWLKPSMKSLGFFLFLLGAKGDLERPVFLRQFASKLWPISYDKMINTPDYHPTFIVRFIALSAFYETNLHSCLWFLCAA